MPLDDLEYWITQAINYTNKYHSEIEESLNQC
nr:MAG TPA: hypothetical protein [Caudoviricetes sp.]